MPSRVQIYLLLAAAIVVEVIATTALARSAGFTKLIPSIVAILGYGVAFWLLSFALEVISTGVVYAIWSGLGIVLVTAVAWAWSGQSLGLPVLLGLGLIIAGVVVVNLFSEPLHP
jgi:small multidrug resistance pump